MSVPTIFDTCRPRTDVLEGSVAEAEFAADLAQVVTGKASEVYRNPRKFFQYTYPTRGLKNLLANVCGRLSGAGRSVASIFRLDTSFGGGKTHGLIALCHAARGMQDVEDPEEFVPKSLLPTGPVRIAAFDGENSDPANGREMGDGVCAHTPWGEIAYALAGSAGYERVQLSDAQRVAPGAETLRGIFGGEPTLILIDELAVYLRKVQNHPSGQGQLTAFLHALFTAVESSPNVALVYTLAIGKEGAAEDAYREENQFIADQMVELEKVSARKATLLNPTEDDETIHVLRRRLFEWINESEIPRIVESYRVLWNHYRSRLSAEAARAETAEEFAASYPLHPEVLSTLTGKTATLMNFQRVRGMLRLLAATVSHLWHERSRDATAIHVHHIDPGHEATRQEFVTRLGQAALVPAINHDVTGGTSDGMALAQQADSEHNAGFPPYTTYVARTILVHSIAFNEPLRGLGAEQLRYSILSPEANIDLIEQAREQFSSQSAYLDDRPEAPMRFRAQANLLQIIRRAERAVERQHLRSHLEDRIREVFRGRTFETIHFPGGPYAVPDNPTESRPPKLVVMGYDNVTVESPSVGVPKEIRHIFHSKGDGGSRVRLFRNDLVFVVADETSKASMRNECRRRLALRHLKQDQQLADLAEHQRTEVLEMEAGAEDGLTEAILKCYRHVYYPSVDHPDWSDVDLAHTEVGAQSRRLTPGVGHQQVERALRDNRKLRLDNDEPDSPAYVRDRTRLRKGRISVADLRTEFKSDPRLPILIGSSVFLRGIEAGIKANIYLYRRGDLICGPGDPRTTIRIDSTSEILTMAMAKNLGIWPRKEMRDEKKKRTKQTKGTEGRTKRKKRKTRPKPIREFKSEGPLKEALVKLWEEVRDKRVQTVHTLEVQLPDRDGLKILGVARTVQEAKASVSVEGAYETAEGGECEVEYKGSISDSLAVRDFLIDQFRDATSISIQIDLKLVFESGLSMAGKAPEAVSGKLSRYVRSEAFVKAIPRSVQ